MSVVVGSGIMAVRLSPGATGLELLENSLATAAGLAVIIAVLAPVSGAHLNPVVSAVDWALGRRSGAGLPGRDVTVYVAAQVTGGIGGAVLANLMFALPAVTASATVRSAPHLWLGEVVATAGLVLVIFALARSGRGALAPAAVAGWVGAAYWATSSTSFANPAVTIGRAFTGTFAGIAPASVPGFVAAQAAGAVLGAALVVVLYPAAWPTAADRPRPGGRRRRPGRSRPPGAEGKAVAVADVPEVLFMCTHNAGRSQMAAALLDREAGGAVRVTSAGSDPAEQVNPAVAAAMAEVGVDISREVPKPLGAGQAEAADIVITMGCGDACPVFPGKRYLVWELPDPAGLTVDQVRPIRDDIAGRVRALLAELGVEPAGG